MCLNKCTSYRELSKIPSTRSRVFFASDGDLAIPSSNYHSRDHRLGMFVAIQLGYCIDYQNNALLVSATFVRSNLQAAFASTSAGQWPYY